MKKLLLALTVLMLFMLVGCDSKEPERYEVEVTEVFDDGEAYIVTTHNYRVKQIWILYTEQFEYEVGDVLTVVILKISDGMNDTLAVPYLEYIDETIDGKTFGLTDKCGGICWYYDYDEAQK